MFRALQVADLPKDTVFTVTIGNETKLSHADWYLTDPTEVFATIRMLNTCDQTGDLEGLAPTKPDGSHRGSEVYPVPRSSLIN